MLRILTFLRDAFEQPPEREGREVWFAKKGESSDGPDSPSEPDSGREDSTKPHRNDFHERELGVMHSGIEEREEEPAEPAGDDGENREPTEGGIHEGEEPREEAPRIRIKAEILVEKAKSALETIAKIKAILGNKEFMDKIREAARKDSKVKDLLASFEEDAAVCDDAEKTIQNLKSEAEQFVLWQDPKERKLSPKELAAANVRSRCIVLKPNSPEEEESERQLERGVHDYLSDPTVMDRMDSDEHWNALSVEEKAPMIDRIEELTHIDETLEKMDETLTGYDTGLKIYLKQIQQLKDDIEKGGEIAPPQQDWGGGSFTLKLIHFVYLAMAVKKIYDTWKKQWEYDFERAVGECAAAISPWVAPHTVTQRLLEEEEANIRKVKEEKKKEYEKYSFRELHHEILTPNPDPAEKMAQLEVAAEKGWLYGIEEEAASLTIFGQSLHACVPRAWRKNPSLIAEYHRKLQGMYTHGQKKQEEEGREEARGYVEDAYGIVQIESAIAQGMYWKIVGIASWVTQSRVGSGQGAAVIAATIIRLIAEDPTFGKLVPQKVIKDIGGIAETGMPEYSLYTLKKFREKLKSTGRRNISATEKWERIAELDVQSRAFVELHRRFTGPNGKALVNAKEVYSALELAQFTTTGTVPSNAQLISAAVGKVLSGSPVKTTDGRWISVYDTGDTVLRAYKDDVEKSPYDIDIDTKLKEFDMGHFIYMNEGKMLSPQKIAVLFTYDSQSRMLRANRGGGRLTAYLQGIATFYYQWEKKVQSDGAPEGPLKEFERDMAFRLAYGVKKLHDARGEHLIPELIQEIERNIGKRIPPWLHDVLL